MPPNVIDISFEDLESTLSTLSLKDFKNPGLPTSFLSQIDFGIANIKGKDGSTETDQGMTSEVSDNYWEWNASEDEAPLESEPDKVDKIEFIKKVKTEEEIRNTLNVEGILLKNDNIQGGSDEYRKYENANESYWDWNEESYDITGSYWEWDAPEDTVLVLPNSKETNEDVIERILLEDEARQCTSIENIERILVKEMNKSGIERIEIGFDDNDEIDCSAESTDMYWYWGEGHAAINTCLDMAVSELPSTIHAENHECGYAVGVIGGYWEWSAEVDGVVDEICPGGDKNETRDNLLSKILYEEEIRQCLCLENTEKLLLKPEFKGKSVEQHATKVDVGNVSNYWAW